MVYVDNPRNVYGRMKMCHMVADDLGELHLMAELIGMKREWFQGRASTPHYDLSLTKRAEAIKHGAVELSRRQMGEWLRENRRRQRHART
jgi:hypothetical protein